ncbi:MAG: hypothetical protein ACYCZ7_02665 [Minisyncoccota bacterium]
MEFTPRLQTEKQSPLPLLKDSFGVHDFFNYHQVEDRGRHISETEKTAYAVLEAIRHAGGIIYEDVGEMYSLVHKKILVRREDVGRVIESMLEGSPIEINARGLRPNVAWWDLAHGSDGLKNAFLEGHTHMNGVVSVLGFEPSESLRITDQKDIPDEPNAFISPDGSVLDRHLVASADGITPHENIRFVVFRFPYEHFPEEELTEDEVDGGEKNQHGELKYVFRGVYFPKETHPTIH